MLRQEDYLKAKLVEIGWRFGQSYTGAGGYVAGQIIMSIVANRVRAGWGSWLQMIDRVPAFMAENVMPAFEHPPIWEPAFTKLLHCVDGVYDNSIKDLSNGAMYWGDLSRIERPWFKEKILDAVNPDTGGRVHPIVGNMNALSFFR